MALGANRNNILGLVLREAATLLLVGIRGFGELRSPVSAGVPTRHAEACATRVAGAIVQTPAAGFQPAAAKIGRPPG
jgi:hypothetical protein